MSQTLAKINSHRAWYVPGVAVWGGLSAVTMQAIGSEFDDSQTRVVFFEFTLGGMVQEIPYSMLVDHRGNALPESISKPVVIVIPRNAIPVTLVGQPTDTSVKLAKTAGQPGDGLVDLWIIEAGD
ncbi:MAG: hypothetical protein AB1752_09050 [Candidatus Zixiibacteriota bacterium]